MNTLFVLLQAAAAGKAGSSYQSILMIVVIFVIFYFFMIRPQSKRQKEIANFQKSIAKGQKVVTQGGIYGTVKDIKEDRIVVEISDGVKINVAKNMVFTAEKPAEKK